MIRDKDLSMQVENVPTSAKNLLEFLERKGARLMESNRKEFRVSSVRDQTEHKLTFPQTHSVGMMLASLWPAYSWYFGVN